MIISVIILIIFVISVWIFVRENEKNDRLPSVYGWSILLLSSTLALASFFTNSGEISMCSIVAGIMFIGNVLGLIIIVGYLILKKKKNLSINLIDKFSFLASTLIVSFWILSSDAYHTNIALQALMVTGYIVLVNNLYKQKKCTESFLFWGLALLASTLSFIPSYTENSSLAIINSWRATISVSIVLSFMTYYWRKNKIHSKEVLLEG